MDGGKADGGKAKVVWKWRSSSKKSLKMKESPSLMSCMIYENKKKERLQCGATQGLIP